jgi:dihydroflavonol-4-reductase
VPTTSFPVLVTGATGYVAAEIVKQLLERGYRVRGTTRDVARAQSAGELTALEGAEQRVELVEADLLADHAFDVALEGCEYVMHVASPFTISVPDPQRDLVDPAVNGTLSMLESADRSGQVKRMVLTSSFAAIAGTPADRPLSEEDWNTEASLDRNPYAFSKTRAEMAAWDFMKATDGSFDLVTINPTTVFGPSLVQRVNQSHEWFIGMTDGSQPAIVAVDAPAVDVRDVALAHVLAMEKPEASGRYLASAGNFTPRQIREIAIRLGLDEKYRLPKMTLDSGVGVILSRALIPFQPKGTRDYLRDHLGRHFQLDTSKIQRELGVEFRDLDETIADTWTDLDRRGLLGHPKHG